jgi:uncharacterized protein YaaN involved in tellurite resistance
VSDFEPKPLFEDGATPKKDGSSTPPPGIRKVERVEGLPIGYITPETPLVSFEPKPVQFKEEKPKPIVPLQVQQSPKPLFADANIKEQNDFKLEPEMLTLYEPLTGREVYLIEKSIKTIDFQRSNKILNYASDIQDDSNTITDQMLALVNNDDMDKIREKMKTILHLIEEIDIEKATKKTFLDNFVKVDKVEQLKSRFNQSWASINSSANQITPKILELEKFLSISGRVLDDIGVVLEKLKTAIIAGKIYSEYYRLVKLEKIKSSAGQDIIKSQKVKEMENMISFFEKRIYDLEVSQMSLMQSIPQLELIKNNHFKLVTKIQSTLTMTIPLWKKQYLTALLVLENNKTDEIGHSINTVADTQRQLIDSLKDF